MTKGLYTLRSWEGQDTESLTLHLNNKKVWDNCRGGLPHPHTKENARCFISQAREGTEILDFRITVHGEAIGSIDFMRGMDVERLSAEVGYWISKRYWNQGIISETLVDTIQYYLECTEVTRVFVTAYEYNLTSMRVLEEVGFKETDIFRKACYKNGRFIDTHHFEIIADEKLVGNRNL